MQDDESHYGQSDVVSEVVGRTCGREQHERKKEEDESTRLGREQRGAGRAVGPRRAEGGRKGLDVGGPEGRKGVGRFGGEGGRKKEIEKEMGRAGSILAQSRFLRF